MADGAILERPFDIPGAGHAKATALLLDKIEERGCRRPDDLDAAVLHAPVDVEVAAGDHGSAERDQRFDAG